MDLEALNLAHLFCCWLYQTDEEDMKLFVEEVTCCWHRTLQQSFMRMLKRVYQVIGWNKEKELKVPDIPDYEKDPPIFYGDVARELHGGLNTMSMALSATSTDEEAFIGVVVHNSRKVKQKFAQLLILLIKEWGKAYRAKMYDLRNEATTRLSDHIENHVVLDKHKLAYKRLAREILSCSGEQDRLPFI